MRLRQKNYFHSTISETDSSSNLKYDHIANDPRMKSRQKQASADLFDSIDDALYSFDVKNNCFIRMSAGCETLTGYAPAEFFRDPELLGMIVHYDDIPEFFSGMKALRRGEKINARYRLIRRDGQVVWVKNRCVPVIDHHSQLIRIDGIITDITEETEREEKLSQNKIWMEESEKKYRNLFENNPMPMWLLEMETMRFLDVNAAAIRHYGYSREEFLLMTAADIRKDHEKGKFMEFCRSKIPGLNNSGVWKHLKKDGTEIDVEISVDLIEQEGKRVRLILANDITERKKSEELLKKSEASLRTIFDNTRISYVLLDCEFKIVSCNQSAIGGFKTAFDLTLKQGNELVDYLPADRRVRVRASFGNALRGEKISYEACLPWLDGSAHWYQINIFPVLDGLKKVFGLIVTFEDITNRKNTELEKEKMTSDIIQRNQDLEQFAYIISHNLRSPVANIIGLSNMLQFVPDMSGQDFRKCMDGLTLSVKKLDHVIIDLNHILRVRSEVNEKKETVRFSGLTKDIKASISSLIEKENVTIRTDFFEANELFTIKSYLNSIFYNLILNSIKYRNPERDVIIAVKSRREKGKLYISFKDNGLGIDLKANGNKIFGLYKKFHNHVEGKGMGLYMVKTQTELLGGKISVKSEVNKGTEFLLEFEADMI
jgi:PAS domain S-box-containing protein